MWREKSLYESCTETLFSRLISVNEFPLMDSTCWWGKSISACSICAFVKKLSKRCLTCHVCRNCLCVNCEMMVLETVLLILDYWPMCTSTCGCNLQRHTATWTGAARSHCWCNGERSGELNLWRVEPVLPGFQQYVKDRPGKTIHWKSLIIMLCTWCQCIRLKAWEIFHDASLDERTAVINDYIYSWFSPQRDLNLQIINHM